MPEAGGADRTLGQSSESQALSQGLSGPPAGAPPRIEGYQLSALLGQGAFGQVWKAVQTRTGKPVAVKIFRGRGALDWMFLEREVERLVRLDRHPHVVTLLDADLTGDPPYFAMDLLETGSLARFVDAGSGVLRDRAARWMGEIAEAIAYVHGKGVIHCDLKPANVLLDEGDHARVVDFGQARIFGEETGALGTLFFMAPEQAELGPDGAPAPPDVRWDVYSLGATIYGALTGRIPHADPVTCDRLTATDSIEERLRAYREIVVSTRLAPAGADEDLDAILGRCLEPDPARRYPNMAVVLADLESRRRRFPVSPLAHRHGYRLRRFLQRNLALVSVGAVAVVLLVVAFVLVLRARAEAIRQAAAAVIARDEAAAQRDAAEARLALGYLSKARELAAAGRDGPAAVYFAESNRVRPSLAARANALAYCPPAPQAILDHAHSVSAVAFASDGTRFATASYFTAHLWDAATLASAGEPLIHDALIRAILFSPDGTTLLTGSEDGTARLWDARSGAPVGPPLRHGGPVICGGLSPDGLTAATGGSDGRARLWDPRAGEPIGPPLAQGDGVRAIAFSPDGRTLLSGSDDGTARLWDSRTGSPRGRAARRDAAVLAVAFSPDGAAFATGSADDTARLWDAATGAPIGAPVPHGDDVFWIGFADGALVTADRGGTVRVGGVEIHHGAHLTAVAVSPDGRRIVTAGQDNAARLWDAATGEGIGRALVHDDWVLAAAFSPDGRTLITGGNDRTARVWTVPEERPLRAGAQLAAGERALALSADGGAALVAGTAGARIIDPVSGLVPTREFPWPVAVGGLSPDGRSCGAVAEDGTLYAVDALDVGHRTVSGPRVPNASISVRPDGGAVVLGGRDGTVWLWRLRTDSPQLLEKTHGGPVGAVAFAPDGSTFASGDAQGVVQVWDGGSARPTSTIRHGGGVVALAFRPDGRVLMSGGDDGSVRAWDARAGEPFGRPMRMDGSVAALAWSPDGRVAWVATGSASRLWDVEAGEALGHEIRRPDGVVAGAFRADGRSLVILGESGATIAEVPWIVEDVAAGDLVRRVEAATRRRVNERGEVEEGD